MSKNIIFYFSGTGNSLLVAKEIEKKLNNCTLISMGKNEKTVIDEAETVGFIYPVYFGGIPKAVRQFIERLVINNKPYLYAIATYGAVCANGVSLINTILKSENLQLDYGDKLKMFSNYVVMYDMNKDVLGITNKSLENLYPIVDNVSKHFKNKVKNNNIIVQKYHDYQIKKLATIHNSFNVSDDCIGCQKCQQVCPVNNIVMIDNKPSFNDNCQHCMACVHYCPTKAINYKNKTQTRSRYTNPKVDFEEMISNK